VAAYESVMLYTQPLRVEGLANTRRFAYRLLSNGVCNARRTAWAWWVLIGGFTSISNYSAVRHVRTRTQVPCATLTPTGGFLHFNLH